jgi:DNA-binding NarL/FixJ family response regulator
MKMQPSLERALVLRARRPSKARVPAAIYPGGLSEREVEVLSGIASGRSNREIAADLVISVRTVERHITNLYGKIGARGRADATTYALKQALV